MERRSFLGAALAAPFAFMGLTKTNESDIDLVLLKRDLPKIAVEPDLKEQNKWYLADRFSPNCTGNFNVSSEMLEDIKNWGVDQHKPCITDSGGSFIEGEFIVDYDFHREHLK